MHTEAAETQALEPEFPAPLTATELLLAERVRLLKRLDQVAHELYRLGQTEAHVWMFGVGKRDRPGVTLNLGLQILATAGRDARAVAGPYKSDGFFAGCRAMDQLAENQHITVDKFNALALNLSEAMLFLNSMIYVMRDQFHVDAPESRALSPVNEGLEGLIAALSSYTQAANS